MAIIYGVDPDATALAAFESNTVRVARWVDIYEANNTTLWKGQVPVTGGEVSVDMSRDERRNLDITLNDSDGSLGYGPGYLWYDKIIKPYRGVILPDVVDNGYLNLPGVIGNYSSITRSALGGITHLEFAVRVQLDALGSIQYLAGFSKAVFNLTATNTLTISIRNSADTLTIGGQTSNASVPGITTGKKVWLRGRVQISNAQCSYWYSHEDTNDFDSVNWLDVGTPVTGTNAGATPHTASSTVPVFGTSDTTVAGFKGRLYAAVEVIDLNKTIEIDYSNKTAAAASITALTGQTVNITGTAIPGKAEIIPKTTTPGDTWVSCLGEFMIDVVERLRFPKNVHVTGRDFTKKCVLSQFGLTLTFGAGTNVATVIKAIATSAGITKFNFATPSNVLATTQTFEKGSTRWAAMKALAEAISHELFFDRYGNLTLRPYVDPLTAPVIYTFQTGTNGNLMDFVKATTDARLKNHIFVVGDGPNNALVYGEASNTNINSPTRIALLGDRTDTIKSATVADNTAANAMALAFLKVAGLEQYEMRQSSIMLPWLEAGGAVEVLTADSAPSDPTRYLFTDFKISLSLVPMTGTARRVTIVG